MYCLLYVVCCILFIVCCKLCIAIDLYILRWGTAPAKPLWMKTPPWSRDKSGWDRLALYTCFDDDDDVSDYDIDRLGKAHLVHLI